MIKIDVPTASSATPNSKTVLNPRARKKRAAFLLLGVATCGLLYALLGLTHPATMGAAVVFGCIWLWLSIGHNEPRVVAAHVELSPTGVSRFIAERRVEHLNWNNLKKVFIRTTDDGPFVEDFFWVLIGDDNQGVAIGNADAVEVNLFEVITQLPGVDHMAVIEASCSIQEASFDVWDRLDHTSSSDAEARPHPSFSPNLPIAPIALLSNPGFGQRV